VVARFADATQADVTPFSELRVRDDAIAQHLVGGEVRGLRAGDTAVVASYQWRSGLGPRAGSNRQSRHHRR
jgi:hypothetical protein